MHIRVLAVGGRQPAWVNDAFDHYAARLPPQWRFSLHSLRPAARSKSRGAAAAVRAEGESILAELKDSERVVALDERGAGFSSAELAKKLGEWQRDGRDLCFVIGGPDGLAGDCLVRAELRWSLSALTLPHGLVRVVLAEQLYRAWSITAGHPYHRA